MKTLNKVFQILAIVLCAAALILFFIPNFATISSSSDLSLSGAQLGFGSKVDYGDTVKDMAKSADILFCLLMTTVGVLFSALTFKFKKMRFFAPAANLTAAIYMLVITLSSPYKFVDPRPFTYDHIKDITYSPIVLAITVALFAAVACGVAHLLIDDKLEVMGTKKLTVIGKIIAFLKDYKSETKKIVWPNFKSVVKNTVIVLVICALIGIFVWALDYGLSALIKLILGV